MIIVQLSKADVIFKLICELSFPVSNFKPAPFIHIVSVTKLLHSSQDVFVLHVVLKVALLMSKTLEGEGTSVS